jgi:hypothetical protein
MEQTVLLYVPGSVSQGIREALHVQYSRSQTRAVGRTAPHSVYRVVTGGASDLPSVALGHLQRSIVRVRDGA